MVPIYINDKEFFIYPKTDFLDAGSSGKCYKVCDDDRILTVKLYLSESGLSGEEVFFPDEETLEKLIQLSPYTSPILLSHYLVRDENGILLDDWNSYNIMLGRVANDDEKLYVFDDIIVLPLIIGRPTIVNSLI